MKEYAFTISTPDNTLYKFLIQNKEDRITVSMLDDTNHEFQLSFLPLTFNLFVDNLNKVIGLME